MEVNGWLGRARCTDPAGQWCDEPGAGQLGECSFPPSKLCDALLRQEGGFSASNNNEIVRR